MKKLTKKQIENVVRKILRNAMNEIFDVTSKNGYKIADNQWNVYSNRDLEYFSSGREYMDSIKDSIFYKKNIGYFSSLVADILDGDVDFISDEDIKELIYDFDDSKAGEIALHNSTLDEQIADLEKKIEELKKEKKNFTKTLEKSDQK